MLPDIPESLKENLKPRSWLKRPEGKFSLWFWGAVAAGAYFLVPPIGAFVSTLVTLAENTLYLGLMIGGVALAGYIIIDNWTTISYAYRNLMRGLAKLVLNVDKIGSMKTAKERMAKKLAVLVKNKNFLGGVMKETRNEISQNIAEATAALKLASEAKKRKVQSQVFVQSRQAQRLQKYSVPLKDSLNRMEVLYRILGKYVEKGEAVLQDMELETKTVERNYRAINAAHTATMAAESLIMKDRDRDMYDQALDLLLQDYNLKLADIESFAEKSSSILGQMDLQNAVWHTEALKMLEEFEQKGESILLGDEKSTLLSDAYDPNNVLDLDAPDEAKTEQRKSTDYGKLFS